MAIRMKRMLKEAPQAPVWFPGRVADVLRKASRAIIKNATTGFDPDIEDELTDAMYKGAVAFFKSQKTDLPKFPGQKP